MHTSTSNEEKILAHSMPIAPEPAIKTFLGSFFNLRISSELRINFPSKFSALGAKLAL